MRVLASPAFANRRTNPYNATLYGALERLGVVGREFAKKRLLLERWHIVHLHWPDGALNSPHAPVAAVRILYLAAKLLFAKMGNHGCPDSRRLPSCRRPTSCRLLSSRHCRPITMNLFIICTVTLLPLACIFLFLGMLSGLYPWKICTSLPDLLVLPLVGAYLLMLLTAGWLAGCTGLWEPRSAQDVGTRQPPRRWPFRATTTTN